MCAKMRHCEKVPVVHARNSESRFLTDVLRCTHSVVLPYTCVLKHIGPRWQDAAKNTSTV
jgi:hypothetical protein